MRKIGLFHPVTVFVLTLVALITSLYLYIDSYIRVNNKLGDFIKNSGLPQGQFKSPETWIMILTLSILVALIIVGFIIIFVYYQKNIQLFRMQQNFFNGFTHELKTPIASLRIFIDTFLSHDLPRVKQLEILALMRVDTERLQENVDQILNLAKIEDRSFKPELVLIDLKSFINEFTIKQKHFLSSAKVEIKSFNEDLNIYFDKRLIEIVFMNILTNAINHNPKEAGNKRITIDFKRINDVFIEVSITDNGQGIRKDKLKDIFKKFYQIGKTVKGSGLGLYIAYQIMKIHRGRIFATSEGINEGTSFHLVFKRKGE